MGDSEANPGNEPEASIRIENLDDDDNKGKGEVEVRSTKSKSRKRETWGSKMSYLLTLVGYAVGFGNIWRFPYQVRDNGGLVFLIPYCIMLAVVGIPIFFLELSVGQRRRKGVCYAWNEISPWFGGLGVCCGWLCFLIGLYYNTLLAYCLSYFFDSWFQNPLKWSTCETAGYTEAEVSECENEVGGRSTKYYWNRQTLGISDGIDDAGGYNWWLLLYHLIAWGTIWAILWKGTEIVGKVVYVTALFPYLVLIAFFIANLTGDAGKAWLGAARLVKPDWSLLWSGITWLKAGSQIFFSLGLGMGCLLVFASYNPERNNCHKDAVLISLINCGTSVFAALVVFPIIGALGHRKFDACLLEMQKGFPNMTELHNNMKYDIYFVTNATSWSEVSTNKPIVGRFGYGELSDKTMIWEPRTDEIFEYVTSAASVAFDQSIPIGKALRDCSIGQEATASGGGTGFVFIGFTEAVIHMKWSNFWAVLFFFMLLTLGIDSGFGTVEGAVAAIQDISPLSRFQATSLVCAIEMTLACLLFPFGWGIYVLDLIDQWTANWTLLLIALAQCIAVAWFYGLAKISYDIRLMTGNKPNVYVLLCWKYFSPIVIILMFVGSIVTFCIDVSEKGFKYTVFRPSPGSTSADVKVDFPPYTLVVGFLLMIFCMIWLPIHLILRNTRFSILKKQDPADFPENQLRNERDIHVSKEEDQFSTTEKIIMGKRSLHNLQEARDMNMSQSSLPRKGSGALSIGGRN